MMNGSGLIPDENVGRAADNIGEGSTDTANTGNNTTAGNNSNDSTINKLTGNRNGKSSRSNLTVDTSNKAFEGAEPYIGCVLGLRFEKLDNKVSYNVSHNKFDNYIGSTMKYGN